MHFIPYFIYYSALIERNDPHCLVTGDVGGGNTTL